MATQNSIDTSLAGQTGTGNFVGSTSPTITTPKIAQINDVNGNAMLTTNAISSAVNAVEIQNNTTGNQVIITAGGAGSDTDIGVILEAKGVGGLFFETLATSNQIQYDVGTTNQSVNIFNFANTASTNTFTWPAANGTVMISGNAAFSNLTGAISAAQLIALGNSGVSAFGTTTFNLTTATGGTASITSIGFTPSLCLVFSAVNLTGTASFGFSNGTSQYCILSQSTVSAGTYGLTTSFCVSALTGAATFQQATVAFSSASSGTATFTFTKNGSPSGTLTLLCLFFK